MSWGSGPAWVPPGSAKVACLLPPCCPPGGLGCLHALLLPRRGLLDDASTLVSACLRTCPFAAGKNATDVSVSTLHFHSIGCCRCSALCCYCAALPRSRPRPATATFSCSCFSVFAVLASSSLVNGSLAFRPLPPGDLLCPGFVSLRGTLLRCFVCLVRPRDLKLPC